MNETLELFDLKIIEMAKGNEPNSLHKMLRLWQERCLLPIGYDNKECYNYMLLHLSKLYYHIFCDRMGCGPAFAAEKIIIANLKDEFLYITRYLTDEVKDIDDYVAKNLAVLLSEFRFIEVKYIPEFVEYIKHYE